MATITFGEALTAAGVTIPPHLMADAEVPALTGPQPQGDLLIVPAALDTGFNCAGIELVTVPDGGVKVVTGEATGNTHWLQRGFDSPGVTYALVTDHELVVAIVDVPEGQTAVLVHTDEHGCNAMGSGRYTIRGKRERADQIRRVAD